MSPPRLVPTGARRAFCVAIAVLAGLAGSVAGCGGDEQAAVSSEATGIVTRVDHDDSGDVSAFTLESDGQTREVLIAADVDYGFDLAHLDEHAKTRDPVHCRLELRDGRLYALSIDDA